MYLQSEFIFGRVFFTMMPCKIASPSFAVAAAILGGIALAMTTCEGAVIDLFTDPQELAHPGSTPRTLSNEITFSESLFTTRRFELSYGTQSLRVSNSGYLDYQVDSDLSNNLGYFRIQWSSASPINFLGDGATAFQFHFDRTFGRFPLLRLQLETLSGTTSTSSLLPSWSFGPDGESAIVNIPFASISRQDVDLSQIASLTLSASRISRGSSFRLLSVASIPEPSLPLLLTTTSLVLLRRRR